MKTSFLTALAVFLPLASLWSPSQDEAVDILEKIDRYPDADGVYLEYSRVLDHQKKRSKSSGGRKWTFSAETRFRLLCINPDNDALTTLKFEVEKGTHLTQCTIRILNPGEEPRAFGAEHLYKERDLQQTKYKFAYPDIRKGTQVEVAYQTQISMSYDGSVLPPMYCDEPLQFEIPCEKLSFAFIYPANWHVLVKRTGADGKTVLKKSDGPREGSAQLRYDGRDVPAVASEHLSPPYKELAQYAELELTHVKLPRIALEGPVSWKDLGSRFKKYFLDNDGVLAIRSKRLTEELTSGIGDPLEKLEAIVTYVQKNISTNGGVDPGNFGKVLTTKAGNGMVNTALTLKLLQNAGLYGKLLLIHSAEDGPFDPKFVSYHQFQMPAISVTIQGREYVVFPYIEGMPVNLTPAFLQGQAALQITKNGHATLTTVPFSDLAENDAEEFYDLTLQENGMIQVIEKKTLNGLVAFGMRRALSGLDGEVQDEAMDNLLTYSEGDIRILNKKVENLEDVKQPLVVTITYEIDNLLTVTPDEILFNTGGLLSPISNGRYRLKSTDRQTPIQTAYAISTRKHIRINYPASWRLTSHPEDASAENEFGQIQNGYRREPQALVIDQKVVLKRITAPKEKYGELVEILGTSLAVPHLFFERLPATASVVPDLQPEKPQQ